MLVTTSGAATPYSGHLETPQNEVHLWWHRVEDVKPFLARLAFTLTPEERRRAERFLLETDRLRFLSARSVLRVILGGYLDVDPRTLEFEYGPHGKPSLRAQGGPEGIRFSVSHSGDVVLYGVAAGMEIGVDVECLRDVGGVDQVVRRFFSARETEIYHRLPSGLRQLAFFHAWTQKEAFLKATGAGLTGPLRTVEVDLDPGQPPRILSVGGSMQKSTLWSVHVAYPSPGYVGAAVAQGSGRAFRLSRCGREFFLT